MQETPKKEALHFPLGPGGERGLVSSRPALVIMIKPRPLKNLKKFVSCSFIHARLENNCTR